MDNPVVGSMHAAPSAYVDRNEGALMIDSRAMKCRSEVLWISAVQPVYVPHLRHIRMIRIA